MSKRLSLYIGALVAVILIAATLVYYSQTKKVFLQEIYSQGQFIVDENKKSINNFLSSLRDITSAVYQDSEIREFLEGDTRKKSIIEKHFLSLQKTIPLIQAIRVLNTNGDILIFVREHKNLSGVSGYCPISLSRKGFYKNAVNLGKGKMIFSNFERGRLPDAEKFCPAMLRTVIPYFSGKKKSGFLVINFWGNAIGTAIANPFRDKKTYSFLVEFNTAEKERDGIFVFHREKRYEFANQLGTDYRFSNVYGKEAEDYMRKHESGIYRIPGRNDFLMFSTISPYNRKEQVWKVCTVLSGDYFYRNLYALKRNFLVIMVIAIFMSVITGIAFSRRFTRPFRSIKDSLQRYGKGELDYNFEITGDYEVREISVNIQKMAVSLKNHIQELSISRKKLETMDRLSSLTILSAGLSHEINTPLNSVILLSSMLYEEVDEHLKEDISTIKEQALRCVKILNNLKSISPVWGRENNMSEINLKEVVLKLKPLLDLTGKAVNITYDLQDCCFHGNQVHMEQIILNLVLNALDACDDGGRILISVLKKGGVAVLRVSDNGAGIPEKELSAIFDPFYTTKSPGRGTGLGLSIVQSIVKRYGGNIEIHSKVGQGTTLEVRFKERECESSYN